MSVVDYRISGAVAVLAMNAPPVNGLSHALRSGILTGLQRALADPAIAAIVLFGSDKVFSGGADIREFGSPLAWAAPDLGALITEIEQSAKPVVAAIAGACMGGGLELALGCHFRIALGDAQIALPEVKLGLLPGAGGTQRMPRAVGLRSALEMITSGRATAARQFAGTQLFDEIVEADLLSRACAFAQTLVAEQRPLKRLRELTLSEPDAESLLAQVRSRAQGPFPAPLLCIDAVAAALSMSFDEGLTIERKAFVQLMQSSESRALRHAFFGERAAAKLPDVPENTPTRSIRSAAVIGAGTMGGGIAMNFANAGIPVKLLEMQPEALARGIGTIAKNYQSAVKKGKLSEAQLAERIALIQPTLEYADLHDVDIAIEAVFEDMQVKRSVFEQLDAVLKPGAILASNTSTLDLDQIAAFTKRPQDVIGLHFFSPANIMRLLEVVRGAQTAKDVLATALKLARTIGKLPVVSGVCDGFIGNRMINQYSAEAMRLIEQGALPQQVDQAMERFGFAMGPFRMSDLAGNDIGWYIRKRHYAQYPNLRKQLAADRLCELGRFGQKTGKGWYLYQPGDRTAHLDSEVHAMLNALQREHGWPQRSWTEQAIVERLVLSLVNEGVRILEQGIALRASDIDMVYLNGYGFPAHRGGPMLYADTLGLPYVVQRMREFAAEEGANTAFWQPAERLVRLAETSGSLT